MPIKAVLTVALISLALSCASFPLGGRATGTIRGAVMGARNLQPVAGATITIARQRRSVVSASDGTFLITELPVGTHTLVLSGGGMLGEALRDVPVTVRDTTCVLFLPQPAVVSEPSSDVLAGPTAQPLLILNGSVRFVPEPGSVLQLRTVNVASVYRIHTDSAVRLYGQRASGGAVLIHTIPHAPCSPASQR
jgi:hypothetical protein